MGVRFTSRFRVACRFTFVGRTGGLLSGRSRSESGDDFDGDLDPMTEFEHNDCYRMYE